MKKIIVIMLLLMGSTTDLFAGQTIEQCYGCRVVYQKKTVKQYVPVVPALAPVPMPMVPVPYVPVYNYIPTPELSNIYTPPGYPTDIPVASSPNGSCAMYVDPYDLFGQIFGGADLVQSCWARAY